MPFLPARPGDFSRRDNARRAAVRDSTGWEIHEAIAPIIPDPDPEWTKLATDTYVGWLNDPMGREFTQGDWQRAYLLSEIMSRADKAGTLHRGSTLEQIMATFTALGAGPVERRKARIAVVASVQNDTQAAIRAALLEDDEDD